MSVTLVLPPSMTAPLGAATREPLETAAVLLATPITGSRGDLRLLGRRFIPVPEGAYLERRRHRLGIASEGYVPALSEAERLGAVPIWFHTHPGSSGWPSPSEADRAVDASLADVFRLRSGADAYGALIASPRPSGFAFTGALHDAAGQVRPIDRVWCVGDDWRLIRAADTVEKGLSPVFDRSVRAFGSAIQETLGDLRIAIVGCGGTGSAVAEQLVRLGVRWMLLIDGDTLSASNVTRVYGSTFTDVGRPKTDVLADHLRAIAPDLVCDTHIGLTTQERTARHLIGSDIVFGCSDDNGGRLVLSRAASYLLTPIIDVGVLLSSSPDGALRGIDGRVTVLSPGAACLVCRNRIDLARAATELMHPDERRRLADEGYAPALPGAEPAVVAFTTAVAAAAVNELLERLIGYGPSPRPSEILLRIHERETSTNLASPRPGHYCDPAAGKLGAAAARPFLEQIWPET